MALQFSTTDRTAFATQLVNVIAGGTIKFFTGAEALNCAASDPAGVIASGTLPGTAASASGGVLTKSGTWTITGSGAGTAASFRIYDTAGSPVCRIQGSVTASGGGGDMTLDNAVIANSQVVTVATFAITIGNG
jgi:hypothetical protein